MYTNSIFVTFRLIFMPIDVVCGMKVKESTNFKSEFQGKTYYFCNSQCKAEFDKNPIKYSR